MIRVVLTWGHEFFKTVHSLFFLRSVNWKHHTSYHFTFLFWNFMLWCK